MRKNTKKRITAYLLKPTWQLFMAVLLFFVSVILSRGVPMTDWEIGLFRAVYGLPEWLWPLFFVVTQLGSIYVLAILSVFYVTRQRYRIVLRLLFSGTLAYLLSGVAKDLFGRIRPHEYLTNVVILDYAVRGPGFPSGHMALVTALGLTVAHYSHKRYRLPLYIVIALVGVSRIYLGLHAPLDILGGFAIGWAAYALFRHVRIYDTMFGSRLQAAKAPVKQIRTVKNKPSKIKASD